MKTLLNYLATALALTVLCLNANAQQTSLTVYNESSCEIVVQAAAYNCTDHCLTAIVCVAPGTSVTISPCGAAGNHFEWSWAGIAQSENCASCDELFLYDLNSSFLTCTTPSGPFQISIPPCGGDCSEQLTAEFTSANELLVY